MTGWPTQLIVRPLTPADVLRIAEWHYEGPWRVYDVATPLSPEAGYLAVVDEKNGTLVGFCCSGAEARVPGLPPDPDVLDLGVGLGPAQVGAGHGRAFGTAVLDHYTRHQPPGGLRAAIQSWNERSLRLTHHLGFTPTAHHTCHHNDHQVDYTIVTRRPPETKLGKPENGKGGRG